MTNTHSSSEAGRELRRIVRINEEINGKESTLKMAMQDKQREIDAKDREHAQHMAVLHSTLPKHVAERVARGEVVNDQFDNASVIFLDLSLIHISEPTRPY